MPRRYFSETLFNHPVNFHLRVLLLEVSNCRKSVKNISHGRHFYQEYFHGYRLKLGDGFDRVIGVLPNEAERVSVSDVVALLLQLISLRLFLFPMVANAAC